MQLAQLLRGNPPLIATLRFFFYQPNGAELANSVAVCVFTTDLCAHDIKNINSDRPIHLAQGYRCRNLRSLMAGMEVGKNDRQK